MLTNFKLKKPKRFADVPFLAVWRDGKSNVLVYIDDHDDDADCFIGYPVREDGTWQMTGGYYILHRNALRQLPSIVTSVA